MTNRELEYLIRLARTEDILLSRLAGGGAKPGDGLVWNGSEWVPVTPEEPVGGNLRGVDLAINFVAESTDAVAVVEHNLGSVSVMLQLLTTAFDGLWAVFLAPWRVLDPNRIEVRANLGFSGPARALVSAIL
jgi:hypothetical protein